MKENGSCLTLPTLWAFATTCTLISNSRKDQMHPRFFIFYNLQIKILFIGTCIK